MRRNLKRARSTRRGVSNILSQEVVPAPVTGMFYQVAVATVLLYDIELWVLPPLGLKMPMWRRRDGWWACALSSGQ